MKTGFLCSVGIKWGIVFLRMSDVVSGVDNTSGDGVCNLGGGAGVGSGGKGTLSCDAVSTGDDECTLGDKTTGGRVS